MNAGMCANCRVAIGAMARKITTEINTAVSANRTSLRLANPLDRNMRVLLVNALYISFVVYAPGRTGESARAKEGFHAVFAGRHES